MKAVFGLFVAMLVSACTTTTIDEFRQGETGIESHESIVLLGRRQGSNYETRTEFVQCVGDRMNRGGDSIKVIPEQEFVDAMFPWFEPRTAPMRSSDMQLLMDQPQVAAKIADYGIRYIVWLDGQTETSNRVGSISCITALAQFPALLARVAVAVLVLAPGRTIPILTPVSGM